MDLTFTDEQQALRESLARYLDRTYTFDQRQKLLQSDSPWSADVWRHFAELDLTALPFGEDAGGIGGTAADLVAVGEVLGEYLCVEPYVGTVLLAGRALATATGAAGDRARELLTGIIAGDTHVAFAHEEGRGTPAAAQVALDAVDAADGVRLTGSKGLVIGAAQASAYVVTARVAGVPGSGEGVALVLVEADAPGLSLRNYRTVDGRAAASVEFRDTPGRVLADNATGLVGEIAGTGILGLAAEAVGAMGVLLKITVEYGSTRQQFGVPIGTFQALAHRMANMKMAYLQARATLLYTTALVEAGTAGPTEIAVLKAQVGRLGRTLAESAVQVHGGIGTTDELPVGHYLKRILAVEAMFGDSEHHLRTVGATAGVVAS